ncbi:MAG: ExeM/NucH family extracellular endonuclease [Gammaproteobacteria bacterium]|nr:ExeM/NucH family extracellular endonuclease [Gammaproteobacteria bacterium]
MKDSLFGAVSRFLLVPLLALPLVVQADVFISEYVEGSGYNKAVEIYNAGSAPVSLDTYALKFYFNGSTAAGRTISLSGTLASGAVYVVAHSSAAASLQSLANLTTAGNWYNGDDAVALVNGGVAVDVIGQIGFDPGTEWGTGNVSTTDNTVRRKNTVCTGDANGADSFSPAGQWDGYANDTFAGIGSHSANCGGPFTHDVQGAGAASPMLGQTITLEAIVVGDFQAANELKGFFIQEEDAQADGNVLTSEGLFVYTGGAGVNVNVGDLVRVTGTVAEFNGLTELTNVTTTVISSGNPLPTLLTVQLPFAAADALERYEGMRIKLPQTLTVTENYDLGRYGQVWLSSGGRLQQPTNIASPGPAANAQQAANDLNRIVIDDGLSIQNPDPIKYPAPGLTALNTLRVGDTVANLVGVIDDAAGIYRVQLTQALSFVAANARRPAPASVGGSLKVASFNVLNYFNGDGHGGGFPTSRGANTSQEFQRQRAKIIAAISAMQVDIVGLMEIENDGYGSTSAIADLVNGLNAAAPTGTSYAYINPGVAKIGTDEIAVGLIYRTQTVSASGVAKLLTAAMDPRFDDTKNRPTLAQTFVQLSTGGKLTVAVNHLKSKGSACTDVNDPDTGDGQGNCNITRKNAALALVDWLATDPTHSGDPDFLIIGDLNSYAKEDPVSAIKNGGYTDLIDAHIGAASGYSYLFTGQSGYLDHALANKSLAAKVTGITEWHDNCDEPHVLDYNTEFKTANQINLLYNADAYRASDHDPVIIGLNP